MSDESKTYLERGSVDTAGSEIPFAPTWINKSEIAAYVPIEGMFIQSVVGGKLMANWVTIEPHKVVPRHQHPHEQLGVILEGQLELTLGDETRLLNPGDAYTIPPHLPHGARTLDQSCLLIDIFTPVREDYVQK